MNNDSDYNWYLTLISILFALFIAAWMIPAAEMIYTLPDTEMWKLAQDARKTLKSASITIQQNQGDKGVVDANAAKVRREVEELISKSEALVNKVELWHGYPRDWIRLVVVPLVLMCLWWWYGMFFGRLHPARSFVLYVLDFCTLTVFAFGVRYWNINKLFLFFLALALGLMLCRLYLLKWVPLTSQEKHSARMVRWWLFICFAVCLIFLAGVVCVGGDFPTHMHGMIINGILLCGVIVTVFAVWRTEGLSPFSFGRCEPHFSTQFPNCMSINTCSSV